MELTSHLARPYRRGVAAVMPRRLLTTAALAFLIAGCASAPPAAPPSAAAPEPATEAPEEPKLPPAPAPAAKTTLHTATSPDKRWVARLVGEPAEDQARYGEIWIDAADGYSTPWLVTPKALLSDDARFVWSPENMLLFYDPVEGTWPDTWYLADSVTHRNDVLIHNLRADQYSGGKLIPSPDGRQIWVTTGQCYGCNKPSEVSVTSWLVDRETQTWKQIGVDLQARWEDDRLVTESQPPHMGYSGMPFTRNEHGAVITPLGDAIQVGGTDYVEFRIFPANAPLDARPLRVFPAHNLQDTYSTWSFTWPDSPPGNYRVEAWAEVRPTVPDASAFDKRDYNPVDFRNEGGKRWAVVWAPTVRVEPGAPPEQTPTLTRLQMTTPQEGWAANLRGRVYTTADGGATWQGVSPAGLSRCDGRLSPRFVHTFAGTAATVAMACDSTNEQGLWSDQSGTVQLFRTTDSGRTWMESAIDTAFLQARPAVLQFLDDQHGVALVQPVWNYPEWHARGALYTTANGGERWELVADTDHTLPGAREGVFLTPDRGWVISQTTQPALHTTEDGGRTWQEVPVDRSDFTEVHRFTPPQFVSPSAGFFTVRGGKAGAVPGYWQVLYATTNGGRTWEKRSSLDSERRPVFLTPQVGYVWEYEMRTVSWTFDGGLTWEARPWEINPSGITDVHFVDEQHGFAVDGHLWITRDGAKTWTPVYQTTSP
jgi:photosystem II stability/assembly factor-like uncharacterized protein